MKRKYLRRIMRTVNRRYWQRNLDQNRRALRSFKRALLDPEVWDNEYTAS